MKTLHISVIIGLGIVSAVLIGLVFVPIFTNKQDILRFTNNPFASVGDTCGQFHILPESHHDLYTVPVLLMDSNSTACVKLGFTVLSQPNADAYVDYQAKLRQELNFNIGDYNVTSDGHSFSITPGKVYTNLFRILFISQTVERYPANYHVGDNPINYPIGTNFTETLMIQALPNAKGFYDFSILGPNCGNYPLAVGYNADQTNSSDFSKVNPLGHTCERSPYEITSVQVSGMDYKELRLEPIPFGVEK